MYQTKQTCPSKVIFCNTEDKHLRYTDFVKHQYQHYQHHQHQHRNVSKNVQRLDPSPITSQQFRDKAPVSCLVEVLFLLLLSILKLCLLCAACHLSSETWYNLSQSTNTEKEKNRSWCWNYGNTSYKYL